MCIVQCLIVVFLDAVLSLAPRLGLFNSWRPRLLGASPNNLSVGLSGFDILILIWVCRCRCVREAPPKLAQKALPVDIVDII